MSTKRVSRGPSTLLSSMHMNNKSSDYLRGSAKRTSTTTVPMSHAIAEFDIEGWIQESDKDSLLEIKRPFRANMALLIYFLLSVVGYVVINAAVASLHPDDFPVLKLLSPRWLILVPCILLLEMVRRHLDHLYVFSHNKLTKIEGRLSFNYNVPSIKYADIKGIVVHQTFWGRVFDYGKVALGTAAQDESELVMDGVGNPYAVAELIEQLRAYNIKRDDPRAFKD